MRSRIFVAPILALVLAACSASTEATPTPEVIVEPV